MSVILRVLPLVLKGAQITLFLSAATLFFGTLFGILLAVARRWGPWPLSRSIAIYTWLLRGTPTLIVLFFCYFALPQFGVELSPIAAALLGLTLHETAYLAEIIRAGLESVPPGQFAAAQSLGLSFSRTLRRIVFPQAARAIVPPYITQATEAVKHTALATVIAVPEVTHIAYSIMAFNYRPFEMFTLVAIIFMVINGVLLVAQPLAERRWALKG